MKSFATWIKQYNDRNDRIGDLARDIRDDFEFPTKLKNKEKLKEYLENCNACDDAMDTFELAYEEYLCLN